MAAANSQRRQRDEERAWRHTLVCAVAKFRPLLALPAPRRLHLFCGQRIGVLNGKISRCPTGADRPEPRLFEKLITLGQ